MISVVNGFVCTSSCEAASARHGKDPSAPVGLPPGVSTDKKSSFDEQPATVLDGSLKDLSGPNAVTAPTSVQPTRLDRIA
jgi:hypothetical protein